MEEQEGGQSMEGILGMECTPEQAKDLDTLEDKLDDFVDAYCEFRVKHRLMLGWDVARYGLVFEVIPCGDLPPGSIPEEELSGE
jgi:hypothetical protein